MQLIARYRPLPLAAGVTRFLFAATLPTVIARTSGTSAMSTHHNWPVKQYTPLHQAWPYSEQDFRRQDSRDDADFYGQPRFVCHIDEAAIATLSNYYRTVLPLKGRILDFCSSWVSHFPQDIADAAKRGEVQITGMGMNKQELDANAVLNSARILRDLNSQPDIREALIEAQVIYHDTAVSEMFDVSTNVVSIDYLTQPVEVLRSLLQVTKVGGSVHLAISNRCFPTKAIGIWLRMSETARLQMVADFLHFAGWSKIEIVELSNGKVDESDPQEGVQSFMKMMGVYGARDPLWVVRAIRQ